MAISKKAIVNVLNEYCFKTIWNEIRAEYRVNIILDKLNARYQKSNIMVGPIQVTLPDNQLYVIYTASYRLFHGGLDIPSNTWVTGEYVANECNVLLYMYQRDGKVIPRSEMWVYHQSKGKVIFAIKKDCFNKIFSLNTSDPVFLTAYRDSDQVDDIIIRNWFIHPLNPTAAAYGLMAYINECKSINLAGTQVLINGIEVDHTQNIVWDSGDYVEIILDNNVIGAYVVSVSENDTGYFSDMDNKYREILHCPKELNPKNRLITHNTCTLTIRDKNTKLGRYFHRADDTSVGQITHNDLSVDTDVVRAFRNYIDTDIVEILVRVRTHNKDNILMTEMGYIYYLYTENDTNIVRHLKGELDASLPFWMANNLEKSFYVKAMFDVPHEVNENLIATYISGLGYYTVAAILASTIHEYTLKKESDRYFTAYKPIALSGIPAVPLVYYQGKKIRSDLIKYIQESYDRVRVTVDNNVYLPNDTTLTVALVEDGSSQAFKFTPNVNNTTVTVPYTTVSIYQQVPLDNAVVGKSMQSEYAYARLMPTPGTLIVTNNSDGTTSITCGMSLYGDTLVIMNDTYSYMKTVSLDDVVFNERGCITIPLETTYVGSNDPLPLLGYSHIELYLNGSLLINGLDYTAEPTYTDTGHSAFTEIFITAMDYFGSGLGNRLEVICHTGYIIHKESGYIHDDSISFDRKVSVWYPGLSRAFIKGEILNGAEDKGTYVKSPYDVDDGTPYYVTTHVPGTIKDILAGYTTTVEDARLRAINNYFGRTPIPPADITVVHNAHRIHSPYMAEITKDIITLKIMPANDPSDAMFLKQFDGYAYIKSKDPCITKDISVVDRRYVDTNPTYANWTNATPHQLKVIHRLTKLVLHDPLSFGDIYDG